ncbi:MAG: hypothetical protein A2942_01220 [Candidatus Lloydbacteria bacterium RIFCSPLOWO2_01_FULL_50_20]|uniref:ATP-dependent Clp protease proteolytic subunit n=1 Tax=Candidatus Lloydbacteria bacterium RIFCSPLOWO2_01_FULL_50_20 TaxID=1798665 RepID=A0A1G2DKW1_9BACT|nr:MAG: hypothetical protein A3C13_00765 [Candidatus Lloydbacteria bacterium RIFCSPHIGHO2_02_FULL_50_11]OGZ13448.1 MAG: hypothetical protein A2942_01220 [Candidatus Lloydbacteria bacterium RIFCSPLOWO2_01_FULL_50_20]
MTKGKTMDILRRVSMGPEDERQEVLRRHGVFFLDAEEVNRDEAGCFYRDIFFLVASGWAKEKPMWVVLNSPGGHADQGFAIHDTIRLLIAAGYTVNTCVLGEAASVAMMILMAGTRRYASPNTQFLLHQVSEEYIFLRVETTEAEERSNEMKRINHVYLSAIAERSGMALSDLTTQVRKKDFWLGAEEALKYGQHGLIDEICTTFPFMDALQKS